MFTQVTFETTAGQQASVFAISGDQHQRTGFGVRRACGPDDSGQDQGLIQGTDAVKQGQEAVHAHEWVRFMPDIGRARLRVMRSNQ
jgi:hypothetical protein